MIKKSTPAKVKKQTKTAKKKKEKETHLEIVDWIRYNWPEVHLSPGNGEIPFHVDGLAFSTAERIRGQLIKGNIERGYEPGAPDILINKVVSFEFDEKTLFETKHVEVTCGGIALELKREDGKGRLSDKQARVHRKLWAANIPVLVSHNKDDIMRVVTHYMNGKPWKELYTDYKKLPPIKKKN